MESNRKVLTGNWTHQSKTSLEPFGKHSKSYRENNCKNFSIKSRFAIGLQKWTNPIKMLQIFRSVFIAAMIVLK